MRISLAAVLTVFLLVLTGCGNDAGPENTDHGDHNDADIAFASEMIPHHAQALVLVDLTRGRELSPELESLAERILAAQAPEIEEMRDWLDEWGEPIPETSRDHVNADHGDGHGEANGDEHGEGPDHEGMPGMMSDSDLAELEKATGAEFEERWLEGMIEHHEGAIEMAEDELDNGEYDAALDLARSIRKSQQTEIETMEGMLGS